MAGRRLDLEAPWPARQCIVVSPAGQRLAGNTDLAAGNLDGWRGFVPAGGGAMELRVDGSAVSIGVAGEVRLAAYEPLFRSLLARVGPDQRVELRFVADGWQTSRLAIGRHDWEARPNGDIVPLGEHAVDLFALALNGDDPTPVRTAASGRFDLRDWLGDGPTLWFVQGRAEDGVMRPVAWSAKPPRRSSRDYRIALYALDWRTMLSGPTDPRWDRTWALVMAARNGDAGGLDQVQALGEVMAAAAALLFRVRAAEVADALALENDAPLWWPLVPVEAWAAAVGHELKRQVARYLAVEFTPAEAAEKAGEQIARRVGLIIVQRPELAAHLAAAMVRAELPSFALVDDTPVPMVVGARDAAERLEQLAREVPKRVPNLPAGTAGVSYPAMPAMLAVGRSVVDRKLWPLIEAPMMVAAAATGLLPAPGTDFAVRLIALRLVDPSWFDAALPLAVALLVK